MRRARRIQGAGAGDPEERASAREGARPSGIPRRGDQARRRGRLDHADHQGGAGARCRRIHHRDRQRHAAQAENADAGEALHRGSDRGRGRHLQELRALPLDGHERAREPRRNARYRRERDPNRPGNRSARVSADRPHARFRRTHERQRAGFGRFCQGRRLIRRRGAGLSAIRVAASRHLARTGRPRIFQGKADRLRQRAGVFSGTHFTGGKAMRVFASVLLGSALALSGAAKAQEKYSLSIATGGTGGVYYPLGGGMANILSKYVPGLQATAEVTGGSVDNLKLIATCKPYIAFSMADAGQDAYRGEDKFKGTKVPLRTLMVLYPNRMHVVTIDGIGITKMADLRGKRVSTGSPGSATEVMGFRVIEAAGLDKDRDMKRERLGVAESVNALKDRKIDAFFWVGGLPTAAVTDLANTPGIKIRMIDHAETVAAMNKKYGPLYIEDVIPKATYRGMDADNRQATVWNILVSHENLSNQTAYNIVKTIFDKRSEERR